MFESVSLGQYHSENLLQLLGNFPIIGEVAKQNSTNLKQILHLTK